jgi:cysteine desulfurase
VSAPIYLDSASIAPPDPVGLAAMQRALQESWGHPGALHVVGGRAHHALDVARQQVADYLGVPAHEIVFTASGREALQRGLTLAAARATGPVVSSRQEHPAMQAWLEAHGDVTWLSLPEGAASAEDRETISTAGLLALSACNHELGTTLWPALRATSNAAWRVVDAVQAAPWLSLRELNDERTLYAISGAKLGAPLGVGVLRVPSSMYYAERNAGRSLEAPSVPWLLAIAFGAVCEARRDRREEALATARARAAVLFASMRELEPELLRNGAQEALLGTTLNVTFPGRAGTSMVSALSLEGVCIAHTASCQSRDEQVSPVVRAAYPAEPQRAANATRWSVSEHTTEEDVARAVAALARIFTAYRKLA